MSARDPKLVRLLQNVRKAKLKYMNIQKGHDLYDKKRRALELESYPASLQWDKAKTALAEYINSLVEKS